MYKRIPVAPTCGTVPPHLSREHPVEEAEVTIRSCRDGEQAEICAIINAAAEKYRGVIPPDCFHDPYMTRDALAADIARGVVFSGWEEHGKLAGVMGLQIVRGQPLIRHAYVPPALQGKGIGSALLQFLIGQCPGTILVGTWADATWAIRFYERHGFKLTGRDETVRLLHEFWTVSDRQVETSVVLTRP
nr:GNAT family N-acetyltransferase [Rhizomicrobium electricum]